MASPRLPPESICTYCGHDVREAVYSCQDIHGQLWHWGRCENCDTYSLFPKPDDTQLQMAYDSSYYGSSETKFRGMGERFLSHCRKQRAKQAASNLPPNARVLDVGCGSGEFLSVLSELCPCEAWGTELEGVAAQRARKHASIKLMVGSLKKEDFTESYFDLITLFHVFEHLPDPSRMLHILNYLLKPGGRIIMSFPNIQSYQARLIKGDWLHLDPPRHLFLMPPKTFEKSVRQAGLEVAGRNFFSIEQNPFGFIQSMLNLAGLPRDLLYERLKGNREYAPRIGAAGTLLQKTVAGLCYGPAVFLDGIESFLLKNGATVQYHLTKPAEAHDRK